MRRSYGFANLHFKLKIYLIRETAAASNPPDDAHCVRCVRKRLLFGDSHFLHISSVVFMTQVRAHHDDSDERGCYCYDNISSAFHSNKNAVGVSSFSESYFTHSTRLYYLFSIASLHCSRASASTVNNFAAATGIDIVRAFACTSRLNSLNLILNVTAESRNHYVISSFFIVFRFASFAFPF